MGRIIPYIMENKIHVPNHQPDEDLLIKIHQIDLSRHHLVEAHCATPTLNALHEELLA